MSDPERKRAAVLFVCLGNICRSPLAEAAFRSAAESAGLDAVTDSAGTAAYHVGEPPDPRSIETAARHGIDISDYRGRQVSREDFSSFTHILALDQDNLRNLKAIEPQDARAQVCLLMDMVEGREGKAVADPYYGDDSGFERTWIEVSEAAQALVLHLSTR